jgi:hypothetical protein
MVTVVYLAYGRRRFTQALGRSLPVLERGDDLATAFSALTFFHFAESLRDRWRLVIYTDAPRVFTRYGLPCEIVPVDIVKGREDESGYGHRRKLLIVQHCAERFDGDLFFVDGDTYFMQSPVKLFDAMASGHSVLHTMESVVSPEAQPEVNELMTRQEFASPRLRSAQRRPELHMWNSGVIGLPATTKPTVIPEVIALSDELYAASGYHAVEQFAWSLVLEETTGIVPADDVVYHYWYGREEGTYRTVKFLRANGRLPLAELAAGAAALRPTVTPWWEPPTWEPPPEVRLRQRVGSARSTLKRALTRPIRPNPSP